ncbi:zinc ribbon domain-containing protein [Cronobacter sp. EKM101R]|nr:zinc ribbon domain-containing protein [Cronobacter sp. EKM101R]KAF6592887.1 zinc ribbon domain-containing protein [Cronobacter sp. EKM102R]HDI3035680.1 zinc ribbon domain-containing protein [Cronobacter turicensis]
MKYLGWTVLLVGVLWAVVALNMDVSVETGYGTRVNNIGLMAARQNHIIIGAFITLCGLLMAIFGGRKDDSGPLVKCPFCAELVKSEAVKCKHCGSDLMPTQGEKGDLWIPYLYFSSAWGETSVNRGAVADLVCYLLSANSNMQRKEIIEKYQQRIDTLAKGMPPAVRSSFLDCYNELMREE